MPVKPLSTKAQTEGGGSPPQPTEAPTQEGPRTFADDRFPASSRGRRKAAGLSKAFTQALALGVAHMAKAAAAGPLQGAVPGIGITGVATPRLATSAATLPSSALPLSQYIVGQHFNPATFASGTHEVRGLPPTSVVDEPPSSVAFPDPPLPGAREWVNPDEREHVPTRAQPTAPPRSASPSGSAAEPGRPSLAATRWRVDRTMLGKGVGLALMGGSALYMLVMIPREQARIAAVIEQINAERAALQPDDQQWASLRPISEMLQPSTNERVRAFAQRLQALAEAFSEDPAQMNEQEHERRMSWGIDEMGALVEEVPAAAREENPAADARVTERDAGDLLGHLMRVAQSQQPQDGP